MKLYGNFNKLRSLFFNRARSGRQSLALNVRVKWCYFFLSPKKKFFIYVNSFLNHVLIQFFFLNQILPGVKVVIANPETKGMCADSHLGEVRHVSKINWKTVNCV